MIVSGPARLLRLLKSAVSTSVGRLSGMLVIVVALSVAAGVIAAMMVQQKRSQLDDIAARREPALNAAAQLYRAFADAQATTVTSFLHGGRNPAQLRKRYEADIRQAEDALAVAAPDFSRNDKNNAYIRQITENIPVYTGLIERAYANQRQGFPIGASYLHEASNLSQDNLLVPASKVFIAERNMLVAEQDAVKRFPWWTAIFATLLLAALIYVQIYLRKRTKRRFNVGLVLATAAVIIGLLWTVAAGVISSVHMSTAREQGSHPATLLRQAQITVISTRAIETLGLVYRAPGSLSDKTYKQFENIMIGSDGSSGVLGDAKSLLNGTGAQRDVTSAHDKIVQWVKVHQQIRKLSTDGKFDQAVHLATSKEANSSGTIFNEVNEDLSRAVGKSRVVFAEHNSAARNAFDGLTPGVLVFALLAAVGSAVGISKRLQEYR